MSKWSESGDGNWTTANFQNSNGYPVSGSGEPGADANNCDNSCTIQINSPSSIDLTSYYTATLTLDRWLSSNLDNGEYLRVEVYNGSSWVQLAEWSADNGDDDNTWHAEALDLGSYLTVSNFSVRLVTHETSTNENVLVDDVRIVAR